MAYFSPGLTFALCVSSGPPRSLCVCAGPPDRVYDGASGGSGDVLQDGAGVGLQEPETAVHFPAG